jgi:seryl-tRNA synthetase
MSRCGIVGEKPDLGFEPKEHFELGEALGMMDFERAAKMSGSIHHPVGASGAA